MFRRTPPRAGVERSFVQFVLEPLYKMYSAVIGAFGEYGIVTAWGLYGMGIDQRRWWKLCRRARRRRRALHAAMPCAAELTRTFTHGPHAGEHPKTVEGLLAGLGVYLRTATYNLDTKPLLKEVRGGRVGRQGQE